MFPDVYEGSLFRPPSEAQSLILQATIGCSWDKCTFCTAFQGKKFRIKTVEELNQDVEKVLPHFGNTERIFLADANALCIPTPRLERILQMLYSRFENLKRVAIYGGPRDIREKTGEELRKLKEAGLELVYFGLESGSDEILKRIKKGATSQMMIETAKKIKEAGMKFSSIFILGLGGKELTEIHAEETARVLSAQDPDYAAGLTLMVQSGSEIAQDIRQGKLTLLNPEESLLELRKIIEGLDVSETIFRTNHASNYAGIGGTLPKDKKNMLAEIDSQLSQGTFKKEAFRRL